MRVFISDKDMAKLCKRQIFLDQNNPNSKYQCKSELIYISDFEVVQKTRSRVFSGLKTPGESFEKRKMRVSELVQAIHGMIQNAGERSNL